MRAEATSADWYIPRSLEVVLTRAMREFPAIVLVGPRQSGKTTVLRHVCGSRAPIVSLDPPDVRVAATTDPRGFLDLHLPPVVFDEVQHAPGLLPYIKQQVDERRDRAGQFVLSGSQNLLLMQQVSESLAGRAAVLKLLPLTRREIARTPDRPFPWESDRPLDAGEQAWSGDLWSDILRGAYPEIVRDPARDQYLWQASYVQTYLERDVRGVRNVGDLTLFQVFLRALAGRSAQLLNLTEIARDVGVAVNTIRGWLSVLEASFQIILLRPYFASVGKRLVKAPKVYFTDTGLLCYLVGLRDTLHAADGPMGGAIFENLVVAEIYKSMLHRGEEPALYFWRTAAGAEVDLIVDTGTELVPIEIKLSATPRPEMARGIAAFRRDLGDRATAGFVVHPGRTTLPLGGGTLALPFGAL